jgi:hypothetical protein
MRLTLRTLLAYLDDTLPPSEIKEIGEKVAESDAAQELIARIKAVTRRRRLTAPPTTGPGGLDPNRVAEYLDNELGSEELAELEKLALESDIHLAEIAACHQILTLVLGEPALVPPTARERMYGLVHGREAIPFRKVAPVKAPAHISDEDDALGLGGGWLKWVLPVAGVLLVVALGLAVYQVMPGRSESHASARVPVEPPVDPARQKEEEVKAAERKAASDAREKEKNKEKGKSNGTSTGSEGTRPPEKETTPEKDTSIVERKAPPLKDRVTAGNYVGGFSDQASILVSSPTGNQNWKRVDRGQVVYTADTLVALPGYTAVVRNSTKGVALTLAGHVLDFTLYEKQQPRGETAVILHKNDKFDLDMTLLGGRVFLRNNKPKGAVTVRLRFLTEIWDLKLESQGTDVGVDLFQVYTPFVKYRPEEEPPYAEALLCLFRGDLVANVDGYTEYNRETDPPKEVLMQWNSIQGTQPPQKMDKVPFYWDKVPPAPDAVVAARRGAIREMTTALKNLEVLAKGKAIDVALRESLEKSEMASRRLAVYCLGALDDVGKLIEVLGDENPDHLVDRDAAIWALEHWVGRAQGQGKRLYDPKTSTGLLINMKFKKSEAETIVELLYPVISENWTKPETFEALSRCLAHRRVAIAQLGMYRLVQLARNAKLPPGFNAASPLEDRERYAKQIDEMITKKQLPPPPPAPAPAETPPKGEKR